MENASLLTPEILEIGMECIGVGLNLLNPTFSGLFAMLRADVGTVIWVLNMGIHVVLIQNSHSSLKLMASIFFKWIGLTTRICAFSLFTILMV